MKCPICGKEPENCGVVDTLTDSQLGDIWQARAEKAESLNRKIWEGLQDRCKKYNTYYEGYCNIPEPSQTPECTYETCPIVANAKEGV